MRDLTKVPTANPTKTLEGSYNELMAIADPVQLRDRVLEVVVEQGGVSEKNLRFLSRNMIGCGGNLARLQGCITNFLLAGAGLRVIQPGAR